MACELRERMRNAGGIVPHVLQVSHDTAIVFDDIVHRTVALGQWCQGFLAGFALKLGVTGQTPSAETQEVLSDLVAIARIGEPDGSDDDEADFMELVEYLRMAAMNLFLEARDPHKTDPDTPSVH